MENKCNCLQCRGLETARATSGVVEHEADESFAVVDLVCGYQGEGFGEGHAKDLDVLVGLRLGDAFADIAGEIDLHPLAEEAGAGEVFGEERPAFGAVAGLFDHLALGGGEGGFAGFDAAGGKLDEELAGGVAVLTLEDDVGIFRVFGLVDGQDNDGAVVTDDVANVGVAAGLEDLIGEDGEDFALVGELGGDEFCFGRRLFLVCGVLGLGALVFFVGAAIKLRYHPASRGVRGASNRMHGKVIDRRLAD